MKSRKDSRSALCIVFALMMLWHTIVGAAQMGHMPTKTGFDSAHLSHLDLHRAAESHHHDVEGSVHKDLSAKSTNHMALDGVHLSAIMIVVGQLTTLEKYTALTRQKNDSLHEWLLVYPMFRPPRNLT